MHERCEDRGVPALAPFVTRYARSAMVCAPNHLAAGAGVRILGSGGTAVDAALATAAVLAVTAEHQCGMGGDLFALVHRSGEARPAALNASGRAGSGADAARLRAEGHRRMPGDGDIRAVPVPGCVDGWLALHARFARLPLPDVLEPARRYADEGFPMSPTLAAAVPIVAHIPAAADYGPPAPRARAPWCAARAWRARWPPSRRAGAMPSTRASSGRACWPSGPASTSPGTWPAPWPTGWSPSARTRGGGGCGRSRRTPRAMPPSPPPGSPRASTCRHPRRAAGPSSWSPALRRRSATATRSCTRAPTGRR